MCYLCGHLCKSFIYAGLVPYLSICVASLSSLCSGWIRYVQHVRASTTSAAVTLAALQFYQPTLSTMPMLKAQNRSASRGTRDKLRYPPWTLYSSAASGFSTPPTTPTQASSQPLFTQEAHQSGPSPERVETSSRARSFSTPPDTGQRLSLPSAKPPIPSSSPVPTYTTSQHVSHITESFCVHFMNILLLYYCYLFTWEQSKLWRSDSVFIISCYLSAPYPLH